jgi:crossover junction endodeoxyribonuclease RuvC
MEKKQPAPATATKKIILGIDPGTRITGYGVLETTAHTLTPLDFGCIRPPPHLPLEKRYLIIFQAIQKLIELYHPTSIAVESQFVKKNVQTTLKLGGAKALILLSAALHDTPIYEYAPRAAKMAVVGHGSASKEQVQKMMQILLKLPSPPTPEDAADALALALCHAHNLQKQERLSCTII